MTGPLVVTIYGTASPAGRLAAAMSVFEEALASAGAGHARIDLSQPAAASGGGSGEAGPEGAYADLLGRADAVTIFSPVYRAAAASRLSALLEHLPIETLEGKPVGIVSMGGSLHHCLAVPGSLHQPLSWFGAFVVPPGIYLTPSSFEAGRPGGSASEDLAAFAATMADCARRLAGFRLRPRPLAALRA